MPTDAHHTKKSPLNRRAFSILDYLFFAALLVGFAIRFSLLYQNFDIEEPDITNVYVIANHIVTYKELPIIGEGNSIYSPLVHTPIYFYLVAAGLLIHNDIYTMAYMGLMLQFATIIVLYMLAKTLFNPTVAVLTGTMLALNQQFIAQTHVVLQRWFEQPLFALSYLCLALAYKKRAHHYVLYGTICFTLALGIGLHGYAALPAFFVISWMILRDLKVTKHIYWKILLTSGAMWLLMYAPVLHYLYTTNHLLFALQEKVYVSSLGAYACQLVRNTSLLFHGVFYSELFAQVTRFLLSTTFVCLIGYAFIKKQIRLSTPVIAMGVFIVPLIFIAALLQKETKDYHFIAGFGPLLLLLAYLAQSFEPKTRTAKIRTIICMAILLLIGLPSSEFLHANQKKLEILHDQKEAVQSILPMIKERIQERIGPAWGDQVSIEVYNDTVINKFDSEGRYDASHHTFWSIFEAATNTKLSKTMHGRVEPNTNTPTHMLIVCTDYENVEDAQKNCIGKFLNRHPNFDAPFLLTPDGDNSKHLIYHAQKNDALAAPVYTKVPAGNTTCLLFGSH